MWKNVIAPVLVVSLTWFCVGGMTSYYITWQDRSLDQVLSENVVSIRAASEMEAALWQMQNMALEAERTDYAADETAVKNLEAEFRSWWTRMDDAKRAPEEEPLIDAISQGFEKYLPIWRRVCLRGEGKPYEFGAMLTLIPQITGPCQSLLRINEQLMTASTSRRQHLTSVVWFGRLLMLIVGPSCGLVMGIRLARRLHSSMTQISVVLNDVAGELSQELGQLQLSTEVDLPEIQKQLDVVATRIREVVMELQQARHEVMRSERLAAVGSLAAGVAHELRNPLTSVKLLIQTAQHRSGQSLPPRTLAVVLEEVSRMETTIQGMLDFARPPKLIRTQHDLRQTILRAINLIEGRARQSEVSLNRCFCDKPLIVNGDAEQLHQVCVNLLINAIEASPVGSTIEVVAEESESGTWAKVLFVDSGDGIPTEIMPRLFEPFVTTKERGTGLGLAVTRRIVAEHGGRLTADNRPEGGARFCLEIPISPEDVTACRECSVSGPIDQQTLAVASTDNFASSDL